MSSFSNRFIKANVAAADASGDRGRGVSLKAVTAKADVDDGLRVTIEDSGGVGDGNGDDLNSFIRNRQSRAGTSSWINPTTEDDQTAEISFDGKFFAGQFLFHIAVSTVTLRRTARTPYLHVTAWVPHRCMSLVRLRLPLPNTRRYVALLHPSNTTLHAPSWLS